jgi:hypothetical protein
MALTGWSRWPGLFGRADWRASAPEHAAPAARRYRVRMPRSRDDDPDAPLKRLGGGRWQTRDTRFTIEPQSGTWVVVDAEQTDELGLPLVRGPFGSLAAAKTAIGEARTAAAPSSPLGSVPRAVAVEPGPADRTRRTRARDASKDQAQPGAKAPRELEKPAPPAGPEAPQEAEEPRWLRELEPDDRRRARRAIAYLRDAGATDPEGLVRRDVAGEVPAIAAWAIRQVLATVEEDADARSVAELLAEGRHRDLGVRWHLVDGEGRRIQLDLEDPGGG